MNAIKTLLEAASTEMRCNLNDLQQRLTGEPSFFGSELLPNEILAAWPELSLDAKAVAILLARILDDENERRWDVYDRM